jgi:hypothetical protein
MFLSNKRHEVCTWPRCGSDDIDNREGMESFGDVTGGCCYWQGVDQSESVPLYTVGKNGSSLGNDL